MEWKRGPTIGRGSSATVSIATASSTGDHFAVKSAELSRSSFLQREKELLSQLNSPYIVQYRGDQITYDNSTPIYNLFMEYVPGGTISDSIKKNGGSIDESMIRIFTHQILLGLKYLHSNGIVHCDIKGRNILIGKDGIKIADLGCATRVAASATSAVSGTPGFMAPEVARGEEQSFPADVWALGCTVIEMAIGSHPFQNEENPVSVLYRVGFCGDVPEIPRNISAKAKDFVKMCLERDSKTRSTVKDLLSHPFFDDLRLDSPKFEEYNWVSPTSVLDQGFWDSVEVPESSPTSVHISSGPNSPTDRIGGLIDLWNSDISNWDCDEDWISVRTQENEEALESFEIESIVVETQEFGRCVFDNVETIEVSFENVLDCIIVVQFKCSNENNVKNNSIVVLLMSSNENFIVLQLQSKVLVASINKDLSRFSWEAMNPQEEQGTNIFFVGLSNGSDSTRFCQVSDKMCRVGYPT